MFTLWITYCYCPINTSGTSYNYKFFPVKWMKWVLYCDFQIAGIMIVDVLILIGMESF